MLKCVLHDHSGGLQHHKINQSECRFPSHSTLAPGSCSSSSNCSHIVGRLQLVPSEYCFSLNSLTYCRLYDYFLIHPSSLIRPNLLSWRDLVVVVPSYPATYHYSSPGCILSFVSCVSSIRDWSFVTRDWVTRDSRLLSSLSACMLAVLVLLSNKCVLVVPMIRNSLSSRRKYCFTSMCPQAGVEPPTYQLSHCQVLS